MKTFSSHWKSSKKPRKQRLYRKHAPLHVRGAFLNVHLSKELRTKHKRRALRARSGDTVKVIRGTYAGKAGKIDRVNAKKSLLFITGIDLTKKDGTKLLRGIHPSQLVLTDIVLDDKYRKAIIERTRR